MAILKIDNENPYREYLYDYIENFLEFGNRFLPFIFMKTYSIDYYKVRLPRHITQREWDACDSKTKELAKRIKWIQYAE